MAFIQRINFLSGLFPPLVERVLQNVSGNNILPNIRLMDSFPVVMANAKRSSKAKVARDFANKRYCSSKGLCYYGVKVHILGFKRERTLPLADFIGVTPASDHDLTAFRHITPCLGSCELYADMAYMDELEKQLLKERNADILPPVQKKKGNNFLSFSINCFPPASARRANRLNLCSTGFRKKQTFKRHPKYDHTMG